jgi:hypothetical protein
VNIQEAICKAKAIFPGITMTPENAKHWSYWGLIPKPRRRGLGKGKGMAADYPEDTPAQIVAAELATIQGFSRRTIARARKVVLEGALADDITPLEAIRLHDRVATIVWVAHTYAAILQQARAGRALNNPILLGGVKHKWELSPHTTPSGKILYHCPVCGLYDPAPVKPRFENRACVAGTYADWWEVVPREDGHGCIVRVR